MKTRHLILTALLALFSSAAFALSTIPVNLGLIVQFTENGFVGTPVSTEVVDTPQGWADKITFKVTEPIVGSAKKDDTVSWLQIRSSQNVPMAGMPKYTNGQEYAIFLAAKAEGSALQAPYALGQGTFKIERNSATGAAVAVNSQGNASLFNNIDTQQLSVAIADNQPGTRSPSEKAAKAQQIQGSLSSVGGPINLDTLKVAAQTIKSAKSRTRFVQTGNSTESALVNIPVN